MSMLIILLVGAILVFALMSSKRDDDRRENLRCSPKSKRKPKYEYHAFELQNLHEQKQKESENL